MAKPGIAILHYTAPPVVGGVESVMHAHARVMAAAGYPVTLIAGRGDAAALPQGVKFIRIPELDSQHPQIEQATAQLDAGQVPADFDLIVEEIQKKLEPILPSFERVIAHNVLTKHFNLPLTAALIRLIDQGAVRRCIGWCHDFTWTSSHSRSRVHEGYPWDLLRSYDPRITYVTISRERQKELAGLYGCPPDRIQVVYNGFDPQTLLGLSAVGDSLVEAFGLLESNLNLLMPVRVTQAKNIEFAIEVAAALKPRAGRVRLVITGPPDPHDPESMTYFRSLQDLRERLDVREEVCFAAEINRGQDGPFTIGPEVVAQLYRVADGVFIPSHREGFGMPILEAGLVGVPVITTPIPAAVEIGGEDVVSFSGEVSPVAVAGQIWDRIGTDPAYRLRRRVRQGYTWSAIFRKEIEPLLIQDSS